MDHINEFYDITSIKDPVNKFNFTKKEEKSKGSAPNLKFNPSNIPSGEKERSVYINKYAFFYNLEPLNRSWFDSGLRAKSARNETISKNKTRVF